MSKVLKVKDPRISFLVKRPTFQLEVKDPKSTLKAGKVAYRLKALGKATAYV